MQREAAGVHAGRELEEFDGTEEHHAPVDVAGAIGDADEADAALVPAIRKAPEDRQDLLVVGWRYARADKLAAVVPGGLARGDQELLW